MDDQPPARDRRAAYYRRMARDALRRAGQVTSPRQRETYLQIAQNWHAKAVGLEDQKGRSPGDDFYSALAAELDKINDISKGPAA